MIYEKKGGIKVRILEVFVKMISNFGIAKLNMACDWIAFQEEVPEPLKKYKKY